MADAAGWGTEADYAWAEGRDACCVSFVEAERPEAVLRNMILDGSTTGFVSVAQARRWASRQKGPNDGSVIQAGIVGGWVVTVEAKGYQATLPEVVHRISEGSRAIVVFRSVHGHTSFLYAVDGGVVRSFDPLLYDDPMPWDGPPLPEESGLDFGSGHPMTSAFACAERLTGVRLTPELLTTTATGSPLGTSRPSPCSTPAPGQRWTRPIPSAKPARKILDGAPSRTVWPLATTSMKPPVFSCLAGSAGFSCSCAASPSRRYLLSG
jgi:hypothetical protein